MRLFNWLSSVFDGINDLGSAMANSFCVNDGIVINPANGLPMIDDCSGVDVAGNPYGCDNSYDSFDISSFGSSYDAWSD